MALVPCALLMMTAAGAFAQTSAPAIPDPSPELRREQERANSRRLREVGDFDVRSPLANASQSRLPENESPCFYVSRLVIAQEQNLAGATAGLPAHEPNPDFSWLMESASGPDHADSPMGKCLGTQGITMVMKGLRGSFTAGRANFRYDLFLGAPITHPSGFKTAQTVGGFTLTCQW